MDLKMILEQVDAQLFAVWFLIGAALVFWMQAGFAWWKQVLPELKIRAILL